MVIGSPRKCTMFGAIRGERFPVSGTAMLRNTPLRATLVSSDLTRGCPLSIRVSRDRLLIKLIKCKGLFYRRLRVTVADDTKGDDRDRDGA